MVVGVGQAESCLLHGIYGSQLDGYAVLGRREQLRAEVPSSLRRGVLVTPVVFPRHPPRSRRTRLSVREVSFVLFLPFTLFPSLSRSLTIHMNVRDPRVVAPALSLPLFIVSMRIERFTSVHVETLLEGKMRVFMTDEEKLCAGSCK